MKSFQIGERWIGTDCPPFIMLEAGLNHNGDLDLAKQMVRAAKQAGADAIKFQTFKADEFVGDPSLEFSYRSQGIEVTESMLQMFQRYEFSRDEWICLKQYCDDEGIAFLSTPQNVSDLELLLELDVTAVKVGSDDFTNLPLLRRYADTELPLLISCGMADLGEVQDALQSTGAFSGRKIALMLCTSQYPTPARDVNLFKLNTLAAAFPDVTLGFSDHTQGILAAAIACGLGACIFEKHFTLDKMLPGPDHWFSETPTSAAEWVAAIHTAKEMLGSGLIVPTLLELEMRKFARRSITALRDIAAGELLTEDNLGFRRPGSGLPPKYLELCLGKSARHHIERGAQLHFRDID